jgi:hypothetical protein
LERDKYQFTWVLVGQRQSQDGAFWSLLPPRSHQLLSCITSSQPRKRHYLPDTKCAIYTPNCNCNSNSDTRPAATIQTCQRLLQTIRPITGAFSDKMMTMMSGPRCGNEQPYNATDAEDTPDLDKRYVLWGPKWVKTTLTWRFDSYSSDMPTARQQSTIR